MNNYVANLKNLSKLQFGDKLYLDWDQSLQVDNRYVAWLRRYIEGSSRDDMVNAIITSYSRAFVYLQLPRIISHKKHLPKSLQEAKRIRKLVEESVNGLKILQSTYKNEYDKLNNIIEWVSLEKTKVLVSYRIGNIENEKQYREYLGTIF